MIPKLHLVNGFLIFPIKMITDAGLREGLLWQTSVAGSFCGKDADIGGLGKRGIEGRR